MEMTRSFPPPLQNKSPHLKGDLLIGGIVDPLSGQLSLYERDLVANGQEPIVLGRSYVAPFIPKFHKDERWDRFKLFEHLEKSYIGWSSLSHLRLKIVGKTITLGDPSGVVLEFTLDKNGKAVLVDKPYGISNCVGEEVSGRFDPRNTQIFLENDGARVVTSNGTVRHYVRKRALLLDKEVLPNGKILKYKYGKGFLQSIESKDPQERFTYASIICTNTDPKSFVTSNQTKSEYLGEFRKHKIEFTDRHKHGMQEVLWDKPSPFLLKSIKNSFFNSSYSVDEKFLLKEGKNRETSFECTYGLIDPKHQTPPHYRIEKFKLPEGTSYTLQYEPAIAGKVAGKTTVLQSDGTSVVYSFTKDLLLSKIQWFEGTRLRKEKRFNWTKNHWLASVQVFAEENKLLYEKEFGYDDFGNPILEIFKGNLTGNSLSHFSPETYTIRRTFSKDGLNLLLREETDDGKVTTFEYLPGTNLLTRKEIVGFGVESYTYDDCYNLIEKNVDEVTTKFVLKQEAPFLHMPEWIEEVGLSKKHLIYDLWGNVAEEHIYDAEGREAYTLFYTYNEKGDLLSKTDPLGRITNYTYDERGHRLSIKGPALEQEMGYDEKGRLVSLQETTHSTSYKYDLYDHLIEKVDPYQQITSYTYDPIVHKVKETKLLDVQTKITYDALGRELSKTDPNGHTTLYRYNSYGSPIEILHPNGGKEVYRYTTGGHLKSYRDQDGFVTEYLYDHLGRLTLKKDLLGEETFTYNAFHLLTSTDKGGHTTSYS